MRLVPIGSLKEGSIVARTIYDEDHRVLLNSGVKLTEQLILRLKENQIMGVHIFDHYSSQEIKDVISPELREKTIQEVKQVFSAIRKDIDRHISVLTSDTTKLHKRLKLMVDSKYLSKIEAVIGDLIAELTNNKDAMVGLVDIKNMKNYVYEHSVQVTVLSLLVGISMHMSQAMMKELAISAMMHDIGLAFLEPELVKKSEELVGEELEIYQGHCQLGYEFIRDQTALSMPVRMGVLQHHEAYNGEGFPNHLMEEGIHLYARIIAVADCYDKMTSGVGGEWFPPNEVIEYIMGNSGRGRRFDFEVANLFVRRVVPFPLDGFVLLSDGRKAMVQELNAGNPLRPIVKVYHEQKSPQDSYLLNLLEHQNLNLTIKQIIHEL
ncbi:MAG: HD domain-containing protein [Vallitaleaceae bacterium]|nr:HD domain-containing protein [Vallitaleaceae bacterium]